MLNFGGDLDDNEVDDPHSDFGDPSENLDDMRLLSQGLGRVERLEELDLTIELPLPLEEYLR